MNGRLLAGALTAAALLAAQAVAASDPGLYTIIYEPGPAWQSGRPLSEQGLEAHGRYMRSLAEEGTILLAGPLSTSEGGLVILRAESLGSARAIMTADPAVRNGQFLGSVSEWRAVIDPAGRMEGAASAGPAARR